MTGPVEVAPGDPEGLEDTEAGEEGGGIVEEGGKGLLQDLYLICITARRLGTILRLS
jgi:hypothetical protein